MQINKDNIPHILESLKGFVNSRLNKSASLSVSEKQNLFNRIISTEPKRLSKELVAPIPSPFVSRFNEFFKHKMQFAYYALPIVLFAFFANYSEALSMRLKSWMNDFNNTKTEISLNQATMEAKLSLSKVQSDINNLKASNAGIKKDALATQVTVQSKEVRNRVAALVNENQIVEAKEIALDLEVALKADELYKVSPEVKEEVLAATDLRVELEKKEVVQIALSPEDSATSTVEKAEALKVKIDALRAEIDGFVVNASTTDMIADAKAALKKSEDYFVASDIERTVLSLQACERVVAELRLVIVE